MAASQSSSVIAQELLDLIVHDLYKHAAGHRMALKFPIDIIDEPALAKEVFCNPNIFIKNYNFIESLSNGRFSANSPEWEFRASLTQSHYVNAAIELTDDEIAKAYYSRLDRISSIENLFDAFTSAAVDVISMGFGLKKSLPWPKELVDEAKNALLIQQALSWGVGQDNDYHKSLSQLKKFRDEIKELWTDDEVIALLSDFSKKVTGVDNFDPRGELIQNVIAASETTASALMWMIDCLIKHDDLFSRFQSQLDDEQLELFIQEVLRVFPPIPFLTRKCMQDFNAEGKHFLKDKVYLVSIVGLHNHSKYWTSAQHFDAKRLEFVNNTYSRGAYIPFLVGPRTCGGMKLANREIRIGLKCFLKRFKLKKNSLEFSAPTYSLTSKPKRSLENFIQLI